MKQNHKYFGMTPVQVGILAGLAGIACLLFGFTGWFALRGRSGLLGPAPQNMPVLRSTSTPFMLPTLPLTETPTAISYEMLIPAGWVQFKSGLVEIWLPSEFKPGDPELFADSANSGMRELIVTGTTSKSALDEVHILISYEPLTAGSLDAFLEGEVVGFPTDVRVAERRKVSINSMEVVRFVFETRRDNVDVDDLVYIFLDGSTVWYVEYIAQINEFYEMFSMFEQSVKTFRIVR